MNHRKFFPRIFTRHPVYICLLLLFFPIASFIAEKVELVLVERLQKQIYKDEISTSDQELFLIVSSSERRNNDIDIFVTIAEPYDVDPVKELSRTPADIKRKTEANGFLGGTELTKSYIYNRAIDLYNSWTNKLKSFEFTGNMETELGGDLGLTPEEKFGLIELLKTLSDGSEQAQP